MLTFKQGNMFAGKFNIMVNTVNCVGVMGKGVALEMKQRFPALYDAYVKACKNKEIKPGHLWYYVDLEQEVFIINFATKNDWKNPSKYEWIESGLKELKAYLDSSYIKWRVGMPMIGCGQGGLDHNKVKKMIETFLGDSEHEIMVFTYLPV